MSRKKKTKVVCVRIPSAWNLQATVHKELYREPRRSTSLINFAKNANPSFNAGLVFPRNRGLALFRTHQGAGLSV